MWSKTRCAYDIPKTKGCMMFSVILHPVCHGPKIQKPYANYTPVSCWAQRALHLHIGHVPCRCNHG